MKGCFRSRVHHKTVWRSMSFSKVTHENSWDEFWSLNFFVLVKDLRRRDCVRMKNRFFSFFLNWFKIPFILWGIEVPGKVANTVKFLIKCRKLVVEGLKLVSVYWARRIDDKVLFCLFIFNQVNVKDSPLVTMSSIYKLFDHFGAKLTRATHNE